MISMLAYLVLLVSLTVGAPATPQTPNPIRRRKDTAHSPRITTTVRSANGTDLTPSFRTKVYWQPKNIVAPASNLTGRQTSPARRIDACQSHSARFFGSHCRHSRGFEMSLREYTVLCQEYPSPRYNVAMGYSPTAPLLQPLVTTEDGSCLAHEICVNDVAHGVTTPSMATCVNIDDFFDDDSQTEATRPETLRIEGGVATDTQPGGLQDTAGGSGDPSMGDALQAVDRVLGGKRASVVISGQDGVMPLGVRTLEVDTGAESGGRVQRQTCTKCFGLRTQEAAENTDFLNTKATLMAATALSGIVWMSVLSG